MGCASSKLVDVAAADHYRPAPASFAVFDINSIHEPWLLVDTTTQEQNQKPSHVPAQILDKLNSFETEPAPHSWVEVSRALEDLKPVYKPKPDTINPPAQDNKVGATALTRAPVKTSSFHTLEELDAKLSSKPKPELRKSDSVGAIKSRPKIEEFHPSTTAPAPETGNLIKPVKENIFILRDRLEREREGKQANFDKIMATKRNPLGDYPEKCPPGGGDAVVVYTTSLRGVRRTFEDCNRIKTILELHQVVFDERDVSLHGEFLSQLKEVLGESVGVPRVFVKGRYIGGVEEVVELNETGRLGWILSHARVERGPGRLACEGCGGARFVPCLECGGSCKVVVDGGKERCGKCNENGLVLCPACL
ncbi:hypothetical protein UlMin_045360 [Ulmus minor]